MNKKPTAKKAPSAPMGYAKGGMVKKPTAKGMHKMPDGKMMKNSAMKTGYAKGGMVEKPMGYAHGGMVRKMPKAC